MAILRPCLTIRDLRREGMPIVPGSDYVPKSSLPKKVLSLQEIHKRLSKVKGALAETISRMREEEG